jgi:hypothetical protein
MGNSASNEEDEYYSDEEEVDEDDLEEEDAHHHDSQYYKEQQDPGHGHQPQHDDPPQTAHSPEHSLPDRVEPSPQKQVSSSEYEEGDDTDTESMVSIPTTPTPEKKSHELVYAPPHRVVSHHHHDEEATTVVDDPFDGIETLGYRVLGVQPNSPAAQAGLVSFFDFLIGVNNKMLLGSGADLQPGQEYEDVDLPAFLHDHLNVECEFCKYRLLLVPAVVLLVSLRSISLQWFGI